MSREKASGSDESKSDWSDQGGVDAPIPRRRWWVALTVDPRADLRGLPPLGPWAFLARSNAASPREQLESPLERPRSTIN